MNDVLFTNIKYFEHEACNYIFDISDYNYC